MIQRKYAVNAMEGTCEQRGSLKENVNKMEESLENLKLTTYV